MLKTNKMTIASRTALLYALAATGWILGSDWLLMGRMGAPFDVTMAGTGKGLLFVAVTTVALYLVLRRQVRREMKVRARAENARWESEQQLRAMLDSSPVPQAVTRVEDGHIWYANQRWCELIGVSSDAVMKMHAREFYHRPEDRTAFLELLEAEGHVRDHETVFRRSDGTRAPVLMSSEFVTFNGGRAILTAATDITRRKKAKEALRQSEQRYRALFEAAGDGLFLLSGGRFIDCNERALKLLGESREGVIGRTPADFSPERQPDGELSAEKAQRLMAQAGAGEPQFFEWEHRGLGGPLFTEVDLRCVNVGEVKALLAVVRDIRKRREAQEALHASQQRYRDLFEAAHDALFVHELGEDGAPGRFLRVNAVACERLGYTREELLAMSAPDIDAAETGPLSDAFTREVTPGGHAVFERQLVAKDGRRIPVEVAVRVLEFGGRKAALIVARDLSERKRAEREIRALNRIHAVLSQTNQMIVRVRDREALFREVCQIAVSHGGFRMAWIGMRNDKDGLDPVAWAGHEDGFFKAIRCCTCSDNSCFGAILRTRAPFVCPDIAQSGRALLCEQEALRRGYRSGISLPLTRGAEIIGALTVYSGEPDSFGQADIELLEEISNDVSFALDALEQNHSREIEQRQLRLQHIALEAASHGIAITDRTGAIEWVNGAFVRMTGYKLDEIAGKTMSVLRSGQHDRKFYQRMWDSILAGNLWKGDLVNRRKDGTTYLEEMTITPVRDKAGNVAQFIAIKQDVTERKQMEQQLFRSQRMESIGMLAGGVAHDLNNVLAPIFMALALLRDERPQAERDQLIETLEQSAHRGADIIKQVLTFARGVEGQCTEVHLARLIKEMTKIASETFPRNIRIHCEVAGDLRSVQGDPTQLHQVLLNLSLNARDAMPDGGDLRFKARNIDLAEGRRHLVFDIPAGRYVAVEVADSGTGISPETLERMFDPFFTTKPQGKGTGLGLPTVLGIVRSHQGLVDVDTKLGGGSRFTVFLPAVVSETAAAPPVERPAIPMGNGETILMVDDEPGILQVGEAILTRHGYKVITAEDGMAAVAAFIQAGGVVQAVVTDIMMPVMDGIAVCRALRKLEPGIRIVACSGLLATTSEEERAQELRDSGVRQFLRKPFHAEELLLALGEELQR